MKIPNYKKILPIGIILSAVIIAVVLIVRGGLSPIAKSTVTIEASEGGTIPAGLADTISGSYDVGEQIHLIVRCNPGYIFDRWVSSDGKNHFEDATQSDTFFYVPKKNVTVTALFVKEK